MARRRNAMPLGFQMPPRLGRGIFQRVLTVILPTLNEAAALPRTLETARRHCRFADTEFIVSDCHSRDDTVPLALCCGARVVLGSDSRSRAMNRGALAASHPVLLFLHADCKVPLHFDRLVLDAIDRGCVGGAFDFNWSSHPQSRGLRREQLRLVRIMNRIRFRWTGNFYGDQGIFVTAESFHRLGGFPDLRLMEDIRFSQRLKQSGRTAILQPAIKTSPRRFLARGVARQFVQDLTLLASDACGLLPERKWTHYNDLNHRPPPEPVDAQEGTGAAARENRKVLPSTSAALAGTHP